MRIDVILDARASADELAGLGRLAEQAGIRGVWVSSLLDSRDPFTNLAVLARETSTLLLGPVAVNPFDIHPVRIAAAFLTLNELARGRARIVIGGGGEALQAVGIEPRRRVRAVAECVEIMRAAAGGGPVDYAGELYSVRHLEFGWLTAPPPPVFVGASMPQMLRMAARVADGIMMSDMPAPLAADALATVDAALEPNGRSRSAFSTNAFAAWHVYDDATAAIREARRWLVLRGIFRPPVLAEFLEPDAVRLVMNSQSAFWDAFRAGSHVVEGVPDDVLDALATHLAFVGTDADLDGLVDRLRRYAAAGLDAISLRLYADPAASIRRLGADVVPAVA